MSYYPVDYKAMDAQRKAENRAKLDAIDEARRAGKYSLSPEVLSRLGGVLPTLGRKARRRLHRDLAELNLLAVLDPASEATVKDRLVAAASCAKIAGLLKDEVSVSVVHALGFKGFTMGPGVVDAVPVPALPASPPSGGPADGAKPGG